MGRFNNPLPGYEIHSLTSRSDIAAGADIGTPDQVREDARKFQAQKDIFVNLYVDRLKDAANFEQKNSKGEIERIGDPVAFKQAVLDLLKTDSLDIVQGVTQQYPFITDIQDNGAKSAFTQADQVEITAYLAHDDYSKSKVLSVLLDKSLTIPGLAPEYAGQLADSLLNGENYEQIKNTYNGLYPGRSLENDIRNSYPDLLSKIASENETVRELKGLAGKEDTILKTLEAIQKDIAELKGERRGRGSDAGTDDAFSGYPEAKPAVSPLAKVYSGDSLLSSADFDWHENIKHPGLKKFILSMDEYRASDPERFTTIMRSSDFDFAQRKYDLMVNEIKEKTLRNAENSESTKIAKRIERLQVILTRREAQLEEYLDTESGSGSSSSSNGTVGSSSNDTEQFGRNRLIRGINHTRALMVRLGNKYDAAVAREDENGLASPDAFAIQKSLFENFEKAGFIDRTHLPNPNNDLVEKVKYISSPLIYEHFYLPMEEKQARIDARTQEHQQRMAEVARKRQEEADARADNMYRVSMEAYLNDPTQSYSQMSPSQLRRGMAREASGHIKIRNKVEQFFDSHNVSAWPKSPDNYHEDPQRVKNYTPEQLAFIARDPGGEVARAVLRGRAADPKITTEEFAALRLQLDPESAQRDEAAFQQLLNEPVEHNIDPEVTRTQNILMIGRKYLDSGNIEFFDNFINRIRRDNTINPKTIEELKTLKDEYEMKQAPGEDRMASREIDYSKLAWTIVTEYSNLPEGSSQLQLLSEKVASLSPLVKAPLNTQLGQAFSNVDQNLVTLSGRIDWAMKRFAKDLELNFDGSLAA